MTPPHPDCTGRCFASPRQSELSPQAGRGERNIRADSTQSNHALAERFGRRRPGRGSDDIQMNPAAPRASERPVFGSQPSRDDAQDRQRRVALRTMRQHRGGRRLGRGGLDFHHGMRHFQNRVRAFSSEVETGSRQENASNQESRAPFRFYRNGKGSSSPSARRRRRPATGLESPTRCRPPKECPRWKTPVVQGMNGSEYSRRPRVFCPCRDIDTRRVLKSRLQDRSHLNTGATTG